MVCRLRNMWHFFASLLVVVNKVRRIRRQLGARRCAVVGRSARGGVRQDTNRSTTQHTSVERDAGSHRRQVHR